MDMGKSWEPPHGDLTCTKEMARLPKCQEKIRPAGGVYSLVRDCQFQGKDVLASI
jgi:hypothetical protein